MMNFFFTFILVCSSFSFRTDQPSTLSISDKDPIKTGAEQTEKYLPYLEGKRVALLANQTTIIGKTHLVDSLKALSINIVKVFGPEHGYHANASADIAVVDENDVAT